MITALIIIGILAYIFIGIGIQAMVLDDDDEPFDHIYIVVLWPLLVAGFTVFGFVAGAHKLGKIIKNKFKNKKEN